MREKIKEYVAKEAKRFDLENYEFCEEDFQYVESLITKGKSLEAACTNMMQVMRVCLDDGA